MVLWPMITDKYWLLPETLISLVSNGGAVGEQSLMRCLCSFHRQLSLLVQKFTHTVALFRFQNSSLNFTMKKKILHHIKMLAHIWSTKCRWNQKLIAQFCCTLRDEHFKPN
jgi:hypothetical protein